MKSHRLLCQLAVLPIALSFTACENKAQPPIWSPIEQTTENATNQVGVVNTPQNVTAIFLDKAQSTALLASEDDYIKNLSHFDWQAKFKTNQKPTRQQLSEYYAKTTLDWDEVSKAKVSTAVTLLQNKASSLNLTLPTLKLVLSRGIDEAGAAYTREDYIVLPITYLQASQSEINRLVAHEFFHVYLRQHALQRDMLYATIGFSKISPVQLPSFLDKLRISNPDSPKSDYAIELIYQNKPAKFLPILYAKRAYDTATNLSFFEYLKDELVMIKVENGKTIIPLKNGKPVFVNPNSTNFTAVVQPNSPYIHQPEEILAENFALWVVDKVTHQPPVERLLTVMKTIH